jgi:Leucine-rich repeat (LRR) protein
LTTINLGGNSFESLPDNLLIHNTRLEYFRLNNNRASLRLSDKLFVQQTQLKGIELSSCKCSEFPEDIFAHQRDLIYLDLSHNSLTKLDDNLIGRMVKLQVLNLSHNLIETISE